VVRARVGSALVRAGLQACRAAGHDVVIVVGHPAYYPRFGFVRGALRGRRGVVVYGEEFGSR
jgi:putative acetyltransferase